MRITVGSNALNVTSCYAYRYQNGKLVLKIEVPQSEIAHDELKALLKNNTEDIVKVDGDKTETYSGFCYSLTILDKDDIYVCEVECVSESERKIAALQHLVDEQNSVIEKQNETIEGQAGVIDELNDTLLELIMA